MNNKEEVMEYIINKIPLRLDLRMNGLKYDTKNIYYKIYMYIVQLQEEIKDLKKGNKNV